MRDLPVFRCTASAPNVPRRLQLLTAPLPIPSLDGHPGQFTVGKARRCAQRPAGAMVDRGSSAVNHVVSRFPARSDQLRFTERSKLHEPCLRIETLMLSLLSESNFPE